jgi:hypothetical protein
VIFVTVLEYFFAFICSKSMFHMVLQVFKRQI